MRNLISIFTATAILVAIGLGCSKLALPSKVNIFESDNAVKAAAKIKEKIGADKVRVIRAEIRKDKMVLTVQSPTNPKNIDNYTFSNGSVTGPEPEKAFSFGDHEMTADKYVSTEIGEIGFAAIPETIKQAIYDSKVENGDVDLISMEPDLPKGGTIGDTPLVFMWRIFVDGPRGRKSLWADKDGKLNGRTA